MRTVTLATIAAVVMALFPIAPLVVHTGWLPGLKTVAPALSAIAAVACVAAAAAVYVIYRSALRPLYALERAASAEIRDNGAWHGAPGELSVGRLISSFIDDSARHRALKAVTKAAIFELDTSLRPVYANAKALKMLGISEEGFFKRALSSLVEPSSRAAFEGFLNGALAGSPRGFSTSFLSPDGALLHVRVGVCPMIEDGMTNGLVVAAEENGQEIRLAQELERTRLEAERTAERLKKTISDLEEFALLAVRRELKMQEIRERLARISGKETETGGGKSWDAR